MPALRLFAIAAVLALGVTAPAAAQPSSSAARKLLAAFRPIVAKANASTVRILCDDKEAILGTIVAPNGLILTKATELRGLISVQLGDGSILDAETVAIHKPTDLALIKIDMKGLKYVTFADSRKEVVGSLVAAAGTEANPIAVGIVSVHMRDLSGRAAGPDINFDRGYLGVFLSKEDDPEGGALVEDFFKGDGAQSGALKAGLKKGDVIVGVNGKPVTGTQGLRDLIENYKINDKVKLQVRRGKEKLDFRITFGPVGRRKLSRSDFQNTMAGSLSGRRGGFPTVLQTDMTLEPKNCGGPIVDLEGKVLGISIARAGRVETWVLPSETIRPLLADMRAGKFPAHAKQSEPQPKKITPLPKKKTPLPKKK